MADGNTDLPEFHPQTLVRDWGNGQGFRLSDAQTGVSVFGATGSGKTSGPAKHLAYGYLAHDFGGLVLCAKKEERHQWQQWAADCGRLADLVIIDKSAKWRFNYLDWEAQRPGEGGGLTINIVNLLSEIAKTISGKTNHADMSGGKFWEDALRHLITNLVDLAVLNKLKVSLTLLRELLISAPLSKAQAEDPNWLNDSKNACAAALKEGRQLVEANPDELADFEECRNYWLKEFPQLAEKTRSIVMLTFSMLVRPFITRPLRKIFATDTNITPESTFDGKIIIVDLPVQEFRLAGRMANLAWKYCFQVAVLRRMQPTERDRFLRPVFLWADEAQNFISEFDSEYQAVARSAGGCTVYLTQNRESYRRVLGNNDAVDSLLGNLQAKFFCQNSGETNEWAAKLLAERWTEITSVNAGRSTGGNDQQNATSGVTRSEQRRFFVEPSRFTTLRRGGPKYNFTVDALVYNGGEMFPAPPGSSEKLLPYKILAFNQK